MDTLKTASISAIVDRFPASDQPEVKTFLDWCLLCKFTLEGGRIQVRLKKPGPDLLALTPVGPEWHRDTVEWKILCTLQSSSATVLVDGATFWQDIVPILEFLDFDESHLVIAGADDGNGVPGSLLRRGLPVRNLRLSSGWGEYPAQVADLQGLANQNYLVPRPTPEIFSSLARNVALVQDGSGFWIRRDGAGPLLITARHVLRKRTPPHGSPPVTLRAANREGEVTELKLLQRGEAFRTVAPTPVPVTDPPTLPLPLPQYYTSPFGDWAVLERDSGTDAPDGLSYSLQPPVLGEPVVVVGFPYGWPGNGQNAIDFDLGKGLVPRRQTELVVSFGVVTGSKFDPQDLFSSLITTSCRAARGNSGGPLLRVLPNGEFQAIGICLGSKDQNGPDPAEEPFISSQFLPLTHLQPLWI